MQEQGKASSNYSNQNDTGLALFTDDRYMALVRLAGAHTTGECGARLKKILVATDFSAGSTHAVKCAVAIASQCHATPTLLHVIDINEQTKEGNAQQLMQSLWRQGSTRMRELATSLSGQVDVQTILDEGLPWDSLVERSNDFDLLVVGENRSKGRWKLLSHHTTERVMEGAHCPVLIVTEYLKGCTLAHLLQAMCPLPEKDVLKIAGLVCEALQYMHDHGIIHRDLKPQNVMICCDKTIRIMDFGIAKDSISRRITRMGNSSSMGTPDYMAPEQVKGKQADKRTDIYNLGALLYEMLAGSVPFRDENPWAALNARVTGDPVAPRKLNPRLSAQAEEIVLHALQRDLETATRARRQ